MLLVIGYCLKVVWAVVVCAIAQIVWTAPGARRVVVPVVAALARVGLGLSWTVGYAILSYVAALVFDGLSSDPGGQTATLAVVVVGFYAMRFGVWVLVLHLMRRWLGATGRWRTVPLLATLAVVVGLPIDVLVAAGLGGTLGSLVTIRVC